MQHIKTTEARALGVPGSDTFKSTHLLYHDEVNRDAGFVYLCVEAFKAFFDTITLNRRKELAEERAAVNAWVARGGTLADNDFPFGRVSFEHLEFYTYEALKTACAFELCLKAKLLASNVVVHQISQGNPKLARLATQQRKRPVLVQELFAVTEYHFDGSMNYLAGLEETSIKFSTIIDKPRYTAVLGLPKSTLEVIRDFRDQRNMIHLPGDFVPTPALAKLCCPIDEFLLDFIDHEVIEPCRALVQKHQLNRAQLEIFAKRYR